MLRGRRAAIGAAAAAATATLLVVVPGCSLTEQSVLVAGRDRSGTVVVGAADCDGDGVRPAPSLWAYDPTDPYAEDDLWYVEEGTGPDTVAPDPPAVPERPDPAAVGGVALLALGDPDPAGYMVVAPLREPLPSQPVVVEATTGDEYDEVVLSLRIAPTGEPDTFSVALGDEEVVTDVSAATAADLVSDHCADDGSDAVRAGVITGLVSLVVVGLALAGGLWAAIRQYKRAGAAAEARRQGTH